MSTSLPSGEACLNCGEVLTGAYCRACGQKGGATPLHFHAFAHEVIHEFLHFDSKIWRTLKLLILSPGTLTRELLAGRRASYIGPIRIFLVAGIVLFGLLAFSAEHVEIEGDRERAAAEAKAQLERDLAEPEAQRFKLAVMNAVKRAAEDPSRVTNGLIRGLSRSSFLLVPLFAFLTWKFFGKEQPFFVGHLYFALHLHAFAFLLLAAMTALSLANVPVSVFALPVFAATMLAYFLLALRRGIGAPWAKTLMAGSLVLAISSVLNAIVIGVFVLGTLLFL